ncbi:MAG: hypothetical protein CMB67_04495 [Euryarchaeota archaeon]|nr:hypothetical protein [Euryarchaeota archaeon]
MVFSKNDEALAFRKMMQFAYVESGFFFEGSLYPLLPRTGVEELATTYKGPLLHNLYTGYYGTQLRPSVRILEMLKRTLHMNPTYFENLAAVLHSPRPMDYMNRYYTPRSDTTQVQKKPMKTTKKKRRRKVRH